MRSILLIFSASSILFGKSAIASSLRPPGRRTPVSPPLPPVFYSLSHSSHSALQRRCRRSDGSVNQSPLGTPAPRIHSALRVHSALRHSGTPRPVSSDVCSSLGRESMSRIWARLAGMLSNRRMVGVDKAGNRYFTRTEEIDGIMKEKRWVVFKGEQEPNSIPVEWICWLNGQRKNAPTAEEMAELEARRELVRLNVARLKEEEERLAKEGKIKVTSVGKLAAPDLNSFVRQFPDATEGDTAAEASNADDKSRQTTNAQVREEPESSEPYGSGESFRPGTWRPPI